MEAQAPTSLLPLDEPRVIAIRDGKHTYTFYFSRITQPDWERYFNGISHTSRYEGSSEVTTLDLETPGLELFASKLEKAEGYRGDFQTRPGWQEKIMPRHANPVAWVLRSVAPSAKELEGSFDPERIEVALDAVWSVTNPGAEITQYQGLIHRFSHPTAEHKRRFYRARMTSKVIGGSRSGTTVYALAHRVALDVYDKLILEVEGYGVGQPGRALQGPEEIRREMDAYHKVKAVELLFGGVPAGDAQASNSEAA